jgi:hypothetical protein
LTGPAVKKFGKRKILMFGCFMLMAIQFALSYILLDSGPKTLVKYLIFIYRAFFSLSLGSVIWMVVGEILPDLGVSVAVLVNWLSTILVAQVSPFIIVGWDLGIVS